jgi:hypothetical protein
VTEDLLEILEDASKSGVYRVRRDAGLLEAFPSATKISLKGARSKAELLDRIEKQLMLPQWWGRNWDALEDCLSESGGVLLFYDHDGIGADDLGVLMDVLRSSAEFLAGDGEPFFAIFVDPAGTLDLDGLAGEA